MKMSTLGYIVKDNKILFLYRDRKENDIHIGKYNGVGGKTEKGESPEQCMKRETFEEAGVIVTNMELQGVITFPDFMGSDDWYMFLYKIIDYEGIIKTECNEGQFVWKNISQINNLQIWEGDKIFLKWLIEGKKNYSAKFYYRPSKNGNYTFTGYYSKFYY